MSTREPNSEDLFAETRMGFGEHLEELRVHLWRAIVGFLIALLISFFIGRPVLKFISYPVEEQLTEFYAKRVATVEKELNEGNQRLSGINQPIEVDMTWDGQTRRVRIEEPLRLTIKLHSAQQIIGRRPALSTLSIQEAFLAYFKVCMACGFVIGSPWIFYQLWLFVAAGLYPSEKRLIHVYLPFSLGLFLVGVSICQFFVMPKAIEALLWFNEWVGLEPDLRFNEWLGFAILMPLVFGISFQLPLVMMFLERVGIVTIQGYKSKWRHSFFLIHVFAAIITPSVDIISMELLALPMFGLYWLGILLCQLNPSGRQDLELDVPDSERTVGV